MAEVGRVDVALVALSAAFLHTLILRRAVEPLFRPLKEVNPNIITLSRGYREPICFDTENNIQRRQRG